ncbi:MAG TPA: efflux RND transporter periplasmic adaptor subunit, partial [Polyangiales bacterium]|nr:efflux RND transporter periplasmic adaptor subunit [Polyangiales bacterium]
MVEESAQRSQLPSDSVRPRSPPQNTLSRPDMLLWLCILLAGSAALTGCARKQQAPAAPPKPKVSVVTLKSQPVPVTTVLPGRAVAYRVADVRPQVSGIIQKRLFREGTLVKAGQQLYQIDPASYTATYHSAAASLKAAQSLAERYKPLAQANAVSRQDYDNAVAAQLQNEAAVETARINLVYTRVLSPIDGQIGRSAVTEGALVTADQATALAQVQQLDPIYVDVSQPSNVLLRLKRELAAGQLVREGENQARVDLTLDDGTRYSHSGKLLFAETSIDQTTGSVDLRSIFPNPDNVLLPGAFVREEIQEGIQSSALLVPQQGVTHDQRGEPIAMVVDPQNRVELRQLTTDRAVGANWVVTAGLKAG